MNAIWSITNSRIRKNKGISSREEASTRRKEQLLFLVPVVISIVFTVSLTGCNKANTDGTPVVSKPATIQAEAR